MVAQVKMVKGDLPRQFRFFPGEGPIGTWMEDVHYAPDPRNGVQREPRWESAEKPPTEGGMPLPKNAVWGQLPVAVTFVKIWQGATSLEDAHMKMWWVPMDLVLRYRVELNGWLEESAPHVEPLRELQSRKRLFGESLAQAKQAVAGLLDLGILVRRTKVRTE